MSILDYLDLSNIGELSYDDNILVSALFSFTESYNPMNIYVQGVRTFTKIKSDFKLLLFYNDTISNDIIQEFKESGKVIPVECTYPDKESLFMVLTRYVPMFTDIFKYNYMCVCDVDRTFTQWIRDIKWFTRGIKLNPKYNIYIITLAGELLPRNMESYKIYDIKTWHRISAYSMIIKHGNNLPLEIYNDFIFNVVNTPQYNEVLECIHKYEYIKADKDQGKFIYGSDELLLLAVMYYHEVNKIKFMYLLSTYTHRTPFYYWLEVIKPSKEKQKEFLKRVNFKRGTIRDFLALYPLDKRFKLYKIILDKFGKDDYVFFEDERVINCIKRFVSVIKENPNQIYIQNWD